MYVCATFNAREILVRLLLAGLGVSLSSSNALEILWTLRSATET